MPKGGCNPNYKDAYWSEFRYEPSTEAAAIFVALFAITTFLHIFQMFKTKTWYLVALVLGGLCEFIGYIGRLISTLEKPGCWTLSPFIVQSCLILVAPALMAASIYMILGRIILLTEGEQYSLIRQRWLTKIFVAGDVASFLMQGGGAGMMSSGPENLKTGEKLIIGGLFVQLFFFSGFVIVGGIFHRRMALRPTAKASDPQVRWQTYMITLYATSILIWIRSVFRVIEYIQGNDGSLISTEVYVFVFDGMLMLCVLVWMNWFHPGEIGLLLRGDEPIKNGLELVKVGRGNPRMRSSTAESLTSDHGREATPQGFA